MTKLEQAQNEYIKYLEKEISKTANYLFSHGMGIDDDSYLKGQRLRKQIEEAKNE